MQLEEEEADGVSPMPPASPSSLFPRDVIVSPAISPADAISIIAFPVN